MTRQEAIKAVANGPDSPAGKRKTLEMLGVKIEYMPHQGKKEMARRLKKLQRAA